MTGATHVIGAGARLGHPHQPAADGERLRRRYGQLSDARHARPHARARQLCRCRHVAGRRAVPGPDRRVAAGRGRRADGPARAENAWPFAAAMHRSLHEVLLAHEDSVMVYPTHGAGSPLHRDLVDLVVDHRLRTAPRSAAGPDGRGRVRLQALLGPTFPRYFARMRPPTRRVRRCSGRVPEIQPLAGDDLESALGRGAIVVDARSSEAHALARVRAPRSRRSSFGTWLGWVVDVDDADRACSAHGRRPGRPVASGPADRL